MWLWLCTRESWGRMSASWALCTQVWAKAKPGSVMYYNNTKYREDIPYQMRGRNPSKVEEDGGSLLWHPRPGWDQCLYLIQGVYQQQESPEESPAATTKATTEAAAAADTEMEAVPLWKCCKWNKTLDTWHATPVCGNCAVALTAAGLGWGLGSTLTDWTPQRVMGSCNRDLLLGGQARGAVCKHTHFLGPAVLGTLL